MRWLEAMKVKRLLHLAGKASPVLERELIAGINLAGYTRRMVADQIVGPARVAISERWPSNPSPSVRSVVEREAALAVLACASISDSGARVGNHEVSPRAVVAVALEMSSIAARVEDVSGQVGHAISVKYSSVPEEALSQLIAVWGAALKIDHPDFRTLVLGSETHENWRAFGAIVGGALAGMGRTSYEAMRGRAVSDIVDMPGPQRRLVLRAIERITAERWKSATSNAAQAKVEDAPPIGSPEWKRANAIFFISSSALLKLETELWSFSHEWVKDHPLNELPLSEALGPEAVKLSVLVGPTILADSVLLAHAVVLGAAARIEPRFFNCRVHKELESEFIRENGAALQMAGMNLELLGGPSREGGKPRDPMDAMLGLETLQRVRTAAWNYADPKHPAPSEAARLARLAGAGVIMRQMVRHPGCQAFVLGLLSSMMDKASATISALIAEYRQSPTAT